MGNTRAFGLTESMPYEFYQSIEQEPIRALTIVMRTETENPSAAVQAARDIVRQIDPALPVTSVQTMEHVVRSSANRPRLLSALSGMFGALAGLLAMVGVYGVTAFNVRRQRRVFEIRLALGAAPAKVIALVLRRGLTVAGAGILFGGLGAFLLSRMLEAMLHDVRPADPLVLAGTTGLVHVVTLAAGYLPAVFAGRTDPMLVLRDG